jgi:hypothetical protein
MATRVWNINLGAKNVKRKTVRSQVRHVKLRLEEREQPLKDEDPKLSWESRHVHRCEATDKLTPDTLGLVLTIREEILASKRVRTWKRQKSEVWHGRSRNQRCQEKVASPRGTRYQLFQSRFLTGVRSDLAKRTDKELCHVT